LPPEIYKLKSLSWLAFYDNPAKIDDNKNLDFDIVLREDQLS
jgi:hypothetical protein